MINSIGILIGGANQLSLYFKKITLAFQARVVADFGIFESFDCMKSSLKTITKPLYEQASLVITPNAIREGKLYSVVPSDGSGDLSVVRATTATRVNSVGIIEEAPYNLLSYSEQFNNTSFWSTTNATITPNATTAPDGSLTADKMGRINNSSFFAVNANPNAAPNTIYTLSYYAKKAELDLTAVNLSVTGVIVEFNLTNGTVVSQSGTNLISASIAPSVDGWYKCSITFRTPASGNNLLYFIIAYQFTTGVVGGGYYLWGAQLVIGTEPKEYFPTTDRLNVARLDYTNSTCPSILIEPQRTNLALRSEEFDNAYWVKTASTVTANQVIAPNGTLTADRLKDTATTSEHNIEKQVTITAGTNTFSIFAKKDNNRYFEIGVVNAVNSSARFIFDFDTKAITSFGAIGVTITYVSSSITELTDGWFRLSLTYTSNTTNPFFVAGLSNSPNVGTTNLVSYLGDGTKGVYIWGAQVETGSNATSYIPTTTATITRNADVISKTSATALIGQTEGTIFTELNFTNVGSEKYILNLKDPPSSNAISFRRLATGEIRFVLTATTSSGTTSQSIGVLPNGIYKIAYKYISGSIKVFINGSLSFSLTPSFTFGIPISIIELGNQNGINQLNDSIKKLQLYKTCLTDAECISLTTL